MVIELSVTFVPSIVLAIKEAIKKPRAEMNNHGLFRLQLSWGSADIRMGCIVLSN